MKCLQQWLLLHFASLWMGPVLTVAWTSSPIDHSHTQSSTTGNSPARPRPWIASDNNSHDDRTKSVPTHQPHNVRRSLIQSIGAATTSLFVVATTPPMVHAAANNEDLTLYQRKKENLSYQIQLPKNFKETQKPLKTHLDEVNFVNEDIKGYQYGITVDPVRINSLQEFGTPEQVAARVVTAEVNRDGIFEVTLLEDPYEVDDGAYLLHYLSIGKRGNKYYYNKIFIVNNQLYVLTAQVKQDDFVGQASEMKRVLASFQVPSL